MIINWIDIENSLNQKKTPSFTCEVANHLSLTLEAADFLTLEMELSDEFRVKAFSELREDESRRRQSLEQFREWISKQSHMKNCRTGLLKALRIHR